MTLIRKSAYPSVFNTFFNNVFDERLSNYSYQSLPAVNIKQSTEAWILEVAAPGLAKEDFKVSLNENVLTISAKKENPNGSKNDGYTRREFSYATFQRLFTLPETIADEAIEANYTDGILVLTLPKKEEAKPKPAREIAIA
jgi:HSP20 family protein